MADKRGILGQKIGMTQIWDEQNRAVPVTVIQAGPCRVVQVKTPERDGYSAIQLAFGDVKPRRVNKPETGHFKKANQAPAKHLAEMRVDDSSAFSIGQVIQADVFATGDIVDVTGISKGKGFTGHIQRHNFKGQGGSHGNHKKHRAPGSIGACATPARVFKGMKMAGQHGNVRTTTLNLEVVEGDADDTNTVTKAVDGVDTIIHTAAIIDLMGGASVTEDYRQRSFAVNVDGTKNLVHAAQAAGVKRFVYTASNSVVMGGQRISGGDETLPYTERFNDLYTETKVVAERFVLSQNGVHGLLTCSIRPSGIWGRGDQTMFRKVFENVLAGHTKVLVGNKNIKLDNSYVHNLIHGFILAAEHLVPGGTAPGQAYFINDGEPINMFEFSRPVVEACGQPWPRFWVSGRLVKFVMAVWQWFHFRLGLPKPLLEPLAVERLYLDNYFSIAKAQRDLGYQPLFTTEQAMAECLPYYVELFHQMKAAAPEAVLA